VGRVLFGCAVLFIAGPAHAGEPPAPAETVIRLNVEPRAAPRPALRYYLLPEMRELQPGNPIPNYLKCLMDQDLSENQESLHASALRQADWAARLDKPDWQILPKLKTDGFSLLIPDVQKMRALAAGLQDRFRSEVELGRLDDALRTAKTMFAMSRHMGEHPTLIGGLVGMAIAYLAIEPFETMLQQPGCPNLYWALTNLPRPLVSLDKGMEAERMMVEVEFGDVAGSAPMTPEQISKAIKKVDLLLAIGADSRQGTRAWLVKHAKDPKWVDAARRHLIESGRPEALVARYPTYQLLLMDDMLRFEEHRDELMKFMTLPAWQVEALAHDIKKPATTPLFDALLPALLKVRRAQARLEQRVAMLRHVEALRLYAADHSGRLPSRLAECPVPLPDDPFTGRAFRYRLDRGTAHLYGAAPKGEEKNPAFNIHYEVSIKP